MDEQMWYNRILFQNKIERMIDNMLQHNEPQKYYAKSESTIS